MSQGDHAEICAFCCEAKGGTDSNLFYDLSLATRPDEYILHETENFVVMPCVGALTDWYVLIAPRRHVLSVGWLEEDERAELRELVSRYRKHATAVTGNNTVVFEHGSYDFRNKGGSCFDHAHVHLVATERPVAEFVEHIPSEVELRPTDDWIEEAARLVNSERTAYLALEGSQGPRITAVEGAPSQFFRRAMAQWLDAAEGEWDWLLFPQVERVKEIMRTGRLTVPE